MVFCRCFFCNMSNMYNCRSSFLVRVLFFWRLIFILKLIEIMEKGNGENGEVIYRESMF